MYIYLDISIVFILADNIAIGRPISTSMTTSVPISMNDGNTGVVDYSSPQVDKEGWVMVDLMNLNRLSSIYIYFSCKLILTV